MSLIILFLAISSSEAGTCGHCPTSTTGPRTEAMVMGSYWDWKFFAFSSSNAIISNLNGSLYTHLILNVATVSNNQCSIRDQFGSLTVAFPNSKLGTDANDSYKGNINQARRLKLVYPHLNMIMGVFGDATLSASASNPVSRAKLAKSCVDLMTQYGFFDGIQITWGETNNTNVVQLLSAFRFAIESSTVPTYTLAFQTYYQSSLDFGLISTYLDWISLKAYWFYTGGTSYQKVGHTANLLTPGVGSPHNRSVQQDITNVLNKSVPSCKIIMGIPSFGFSWQLNSSQSASLPELYNTTSITPQLDGTDWAGFGYVDYEVPVVSGIGASEWISIWDSTAEAMFYYHLGNRRVISYESAQSIRAKLKWLFSRNLAGIMIDDVNGDQTYNMIVSNALYVLERNSSCNGNQLSSYSSSTISNVRTALSSTSYVKQSTASSLPSSAITEIQTFTKPLSPSRLESSITSSSRSSDSGVSRISSSTTSTPIASAMRSSTFNDGITSRSTSPTTPTKTSISGNHTPKMISSSEFSSTSAMLQSLIPIGVLSTAMTNSLSRLMQSGISRSAGPAVSRSFRIMNGAVFTAWTIQISLFTDTRQFTQEQRQLEANYLHSALTRTLKADSVRFANIEIISSTSSASSVSFLILPKNLFDSDSLEGDEIVNLFIDQMQMPSNYLRENSILQFAISPPTPVSLSTCLVRFCNYNYKVLTSYIEQCPTDAPISRSSFLSQSKFTVIGIASSMSVLSLAACALFYRRNRLMSRNENLRNLNRFSTRTGSPIASEAVVMGPILAVPTRPAMVSGIF